ncbi:MAG: hypothetical protein WCX48_00300 [Bacteroidales bacterium]
MKTDNLQLKLTSKLNTKNLIIAGLLTIIGIVAIVLSWTITGIILIIAGVILFLVKPKQEIYKPTGSVVNKYSSYFDKEYITQLEKIVRGNITEETANFKLSNSGSGRIDVIISADKEFIAVQLFRFVPHTYEQATEFISYTGPQAKQLIDYLEKCRKEIR